MKVAGIPIVTLVLILGAGWLIYHYVQKQQGVVDGPPHKPVPGPGRHSHHPAVAGY